MGTVVYPAEYDQWTDKIDRVDIYYADHINTAYARLLKIQQVLGLNPQSTFTTVSDRIGSLEVPQLPFLLIGILDNENIITANLDFTIESSVT